LRRDHDLFEVIFSYRLLRYRNGRANRYCQSHHRSHFSG
jgi:hypothetical protein